MVGSRTCFINLTREFVVGELALPFGPAQIVLEILETITVDDRVVGTGKPGPLTTEIQRTYFATVRGELDRYKDWLDHVDSRFGAPPRARRRRP